MKPRVRSYGEQRYAKIPQILLEDEQVTSDEIALYAMYAKHIDKDGVCFPGNTSLRKRLGWCKDKFHRVKSGLESKGWIYSEQGRREDRPEGYKGKRKSNWSTCDVVLFWAHGDKQAFLKNELGIENTATLPCPVLSGTAESSPTNKDTNHAQPKPDPPQKTHTKARRVCAQSDLSPDQEKAIDAIVQQYRVAGKLRNEGALRSVLRRKALAGELIEPHKPKTETCEALERVKQWEREAKND